MGYNTFTRCNALTHLEVPEGVKTIPYGFCTNCDNLAKVVLPSSLTSVDDYAFAACIELREILLPEGLQKIGGMVFAQCDKLSTVKLPSTLKSIGYKSFSSCPSLRQIDIAAITPPELDSPVFDEDAYNQVSLIVPNESIEKYKNANEWSNFFNLSSAEVQPSFTTVEITGRTITNNSSSDLCIFTIQGMRVATLSSGKSCTLSSGGIYLISNNHFTNKVVIK
jgi:hypothetical protein